MLDRKLSVKAALILIGLGVGGMTVAFSTTYAEEKEQHAREVEASDLFLRVKVIGRLGGPLGDVISIKGIWVDEISKEMELRFRVTEIDGRSLDEPVEFLVGEVLPFEGFIGSSSPYANKTESGEPVVADKHLDRPKKSILQAVTAAVASSYQRFYFEDPNKNRIGRIHPKENEVWELRGFETGTLRGHSPSLDKELEPDNHLRSQGGGYRLRPEFRYLQAKRIVEEKNKI